MGGFLPVAEAKVFLGCHEGLGLAGRVLHERVNLLNTQKSKFIVLIMRRTSPKIRPKLFLSWPERLLPILWSLREVASSDVLEAADIPGEALPYLQLGSMQMFMCIRKGRASSVTSCIIPFPHMLTVLKLFTGGCHLCRLFDQGLALKSLLAKSFLNSVAFCLPLFCLRFIKADSAWKCFGYFL